MFEFKVKKSQDVFKAFSSISDLSDVVDHQLGAYGKRAAIRFDNGSDYQSLDFQEYLAYIQAMIRYFQKQGTEQKVIATLCKNRLEWDMVALGSFYTANIIFPLDTKTNPDEFDHLLRICRPDFILVSHGQLARFREVKRRHGLDTRILVADLFPVFEDLNVDPHVLEAGEISMRGICNLGQDTTPLIPSPLLRDPDCILGHYPTSGTTSLPKIVRVTHRNIVSEVNCAMDVLNLRPNEDVLNIGPYTHIATLVEFLVSKTRGFTVTYFTREPDEDDVLEGEIEKLKKKGVRIKALMAVPKFWIYLMKDVLEEMKNKPVLHNLYAYLSGIEKNDKLYDIGTLELAKLTAMRILLRNKLGGYFSYGISSSMKIDAAVVEIFGKLGITVLDIYGATECSGIISRNKLNEIHPGSCGKLLEILDYRLSDLRRIKGVDHEVGILEVRGPTVAHSYIENGTSLEKIRVDEEGYLTTGDLAYVDAERRVYLVGREKELIHWRDGSYIDPQYMSNLLVRNIFVKDAMIAHSHPDNDFLDAYLFPDYVRIRKDPSWAKEIATGVSEDAALKSRLVEGIRFAESIARITPELNKRNIFILPRKLERTPTHKIKFVFEMKRINLARMI